MIRLQIERADDDRYVEELDGEAVPRIGDEIRFMGQHLIVRRVVWNGGRIRKNYVDHVSVICEPVKDAET